MKNKWMYGACFFYLFLSATALAVPTADSLPSSSNPSAVFSSLKSLKTNSVKRQLALGKTLRVNARKPAFLKGAGSLSLILKKVIIKGNTIYSDKELSKFFQADLGQRLTISEIETIPALITAKYRSDGYILTHAFLPPQRLKDGTVLIQVVEGYVDTVSVKGNLRTNTRLLLTAYANQVKRGRALKNTTLERYALLANDIPGVRVTLVVRPSKTKPGAAHVIFRAKESVIQTQTFFDNRGSRLFGPFQFGHSIYVNGLVTGGQTGLRGIFDDSTRELRFFQFRHEQAYGTNGTRILFTAENTRTRPNFSTIPSQATLEGITGVGKSFKFIVKHPLIRSRRENLTVSATIDALHSEDTFFGSTLFSDHIRSLRVGADYNNVDDKHGFNSLSIKLSQGLPIFEASQNTDPLLSRAGAHGTYTKIKLDASRLQVLPHSFSLLVAGTSQYGVQALLASEQFRFGGPDYGRGYDPSEIAGDSGLAGKVELRYDIQNIPSKLPISAAQWYAFVDSGVVYNHNKNLLAGTLSATSGGLGFRVAARKHLSGFIELAKPFTRMITNESGKNARVYAGLSFTMSLDKTSLERVAQYGKRHDPFGTNNHIRTVPNYVEMKADPPKRYAPSTFNKHIRGEGK